MSSRHILYTYDNLDEYNQYYEELKAEGKQIHSFLYDMTDNLLSENPEMTIDISAVIEAVPHTPGSVQNVLYNLRYLDEDSKVIIKSKLADQAIDLFYELFDNFSPLYETEDSGEEGEEDSSMLKRRNLYTYDNLDEYNQYYEELKAEGKQIHSFLYESTNQLLSENSGVTIDISAVVKTSSENPGVVQNVLYNLRYLDEDSKVIIKSKLADQAIDLFYELFDNFSPLYETETENNNNNNNNNKHNIIPFKRKILYTYKNRSQIERIIDFANENGIPFTNFAIYNGINRENFNLLSHKKKKSLIDITTLVDIAIKNPENIFIFEQGIQYLPHYNAIVSEKMADTALELYNFLFSSKKPISELFTDLDFESTDINEVSEDETKKVVDSESVDLIKENLSNQLIGHDEFKKRFKDALDDFLLLNSFGIKKIFSIFLLGNSGLGKTEVARIISRALNADKRYVKINFGNYSSNDALNSLIGSPRGFIGSEEGELSLKINKYAAGLILCDEFDKANSPVYNFFLELLEDGLFTDSQSLEYDLDGYIIIFTSNINEYQFYERIPNELQSRLDLVCEFKELTYSEKMDYVEFQIKNFLEKFPSKELPKFSEQDNAYFKGVDIFSTDNLRDIKRLVHNRILEKIKEYKS